MELSGFVFKQTFDDMSPSFCWGVLASSSSLSEQEDSESSAEEALPHFGD